MEKNRSKINIRDGNNFLFQMRRKPDEESSYNPVVEDGEKKKESRMLLAETEASLGQMKKVVKTEEQN